MNDIEVQQLIKSYDLWVLIRWKWVIVFQSWIPSGTCDFFKFPRTRLILNVSQLKLGTFWFFDDPTYSDALDQLGLQTLSERRQQLCKKFATKCLNNDKSKDMFPLDNAKNGDKFKVNFARHSRLLYSAIPQMQRLLNQI